jgi:hypothetical protein
MFFKGKKEKAKKALLNERGVVRSKTPRERPIQVIKKLVGSLL